MSQDAASPTPAGTVTFSDGYGSTLGTATLPATVTSRAGINRTAPPEYSLPLKASYTPLGGTARISTSGVMVTLIISDPVPVAIRLDPNPTPGPVVVEAVLGSGFTAVSAALLVDGKGWTGPIPTADGVTVVVRNATLSDHTIVVQYSTPGQQP